MKDRHDKGTKDIEHFDLDADQYLYPTSSIPGVEPLSYDELQAMHAQKEKPRGRGRPKQYTSAAEKQRAYRERLKVGTWNYAALTRTTRGFINLQIEESKNCITEERRIAYENQAVGAYGLWRVICLDEAQEHDIKVFEAILYPDG